MSEIEALEEIVDRSRLTGNFKCPNRSGRLMRGLAISPQFERARAARPAKAVAVVAVAPPSQVPADECAAPLPEITDYRSLVLCLRERADALDVSREAISELAGLPDRYAAKVLSVGGPKRIGMTSLGALLSALSIKLVAVVDDEALRRNRSRYVRRSEPHTISAMRGHANVKPEKLAARDARMGGEEGAGRHQGCGGRSRQGSADESGKPAGETAAQAGVAQCRRVGKQRECSCLHQ